PIQVAVFTNLSRDHLDYHGDMETYFAAKARLFARPEVTLAVINHDDVHGRRLLEKLPDGVKAVSFGHGAVADVHPRRMDFTASGLRRTLVVGADDLDCELPLYGDFNVSNVMAVVAPLHGLGHDAEGIRRALSALTPVPGRMEPVVAESGPR